MTQIVKTVVLSKIFTFFVTLISFFFISTARSLIQINSLMYSSESKGMGSPSVDEDEIVHHQEPKSILITGGAGYIATHTIICLLNAGYHVTVVDNLINSSEEGLRRVREITGCENDKIRFYNVDMCNFDALQKIFSESQTKFHSCIHFAGLKAVGESVDKPLLYYKNNLVSTMNLLELMDKHGCHSLVFSSSATVYGTAEVPITEATPTGVGISNPYGKTKHMIEDIIHDFKKSKDLVKGSPRDWSVVILRYFNPVGAHPSGRIGEDPNGPPNNLMPYISQVAVGKREFLTVFGDDYPTHDGTGVRDYIHVMDLAEGHMSALKYIDEGAGGFNQCSVFNLGTGVGYSVFDMVQAMREVSGSALPCVVGPRREGDVAVCYADCSKAKEVLGWTARRTLVDMCKDTWNWQSSNPHGYKL
mmetsp:Transcript_26422/g.36364  ORF Transcript_26422/g.36364 Transcript_26422/m.36364 type:complete len:418 (+) Transcript_26422:22-1275(+)